MLSFIAKLPKSFPRGGKFGDLTVRRVEFSLQPGENRTQDLVLRQAPLLMDYDVDEQNHPLVLARDVEEMSIEFWSLKAEDWIDTWTETNQLPELVRVSLVTRRGASATSERVESTIVVKPAAEAVQVASQAGARPGPAPPIPQPRPQPQPPVQR